MPSMILLAYPAPETIPSQGLLEGLERGLKREGKSCILSRPIWFKRVKESSKRKTKKR